MELIELKDKIEDFNGLNFICIDIRCSYCVFANLLDNSCEGGTKDYDWKAIKELDLPNDTVVTKELLKDYRHKT